MTWEKKINPKKICQGKITQSFPGKITQMLRSEVPILVNSKNDLILFHFVHFLAMC